MHAVHSAATGKRFGEQRKLELKDYRYRSTARQVLHQEMPDVWRDNLPSPEEIWIGGRTAQGGWQFNTNVSENNTVLRNYRWHREENFPEILRDMMDYHDCEDISMFIGQCDGCNKTLGWHFDDYHVWAFNIEGVTEWQWFDCRSGEIQKQVLEPGYIITMPLGVTHRVEMISEYRTSISIITRYGVEHMRIPEERK